MSKSDRFELRLHPSTLEKIDAWRRASSDIPSRSEAVRRLVEMGLTGSPAPIPQHDHFPSYETLPMPKAYPETKNVINPVITFGPHPSKPGSRLKS